MSNNPFTRPSWNILKGELQGKLFEALPPCLFPDAGNKLVLKPYLDL